MNPAALTEPFEAYAGSPFEAYVVIEAATVGPETWRAQLKRAAGDTTAVTSFSVTPEDGDGIELPETDGGDPVDQAGNIVLTLALTAAQTRALIDTTTRPFVVHVFDVEKIPTSGDPVTFLSGRLRTVRDVSRA